MAPLNLILIGAGVMGCNYLRAAKARGIEISGIIDTDLEKARRAAAEYGCRVMTSAAPPPDAAVIAVPTAAHGATALPLLPAGVHCLVEKPLAGAESECRALIDAAASNRRILQVGHVERFNPAAEALLARKIDPALITALKARRMGPASARVTDLSVVTDLMVHDLDLILALKQTAVGKVEARGSADHAEAILTFDDGAIATLTASRVGSARIRDLDVMAAGETYHLDYLAKSLLIAPGATQDDADVGTVTYAGDALGAQLAHFVACVQGHDRPRVDGGNALDVLRLAWRIEAALGSAA